MKTEDETEKLAREIALMSDEEFDEICKSTIEYIKQKKYMKTENKTAEDVLTNVLPQWHNHISFVGHEAVIKSMKEYAEQERRKAFEFIKWLTSKESKYAVMYGGTPELEKDYRFADEQKEYTIEELYAHYSKENPLK